MGWNLFKKRSERVNGHPLDEAEEKSEENAEASEKDDDEETIDEVLEEYHASRASRRTLTTRIRSHTRELRAFDPDTDEHDIAALSKKATATG